MQRVSVTGWVPKVLKEKDIIEEAYLTRDDIKAVIDCVLYRTKSEALDSFEKMNEEDNTNPEVRKVRVSVTVDVEKM